MFTKPKAGEQQELTILLCFPASSVPGGVSVAMNHLIMASCLQIKIAPCSISTMDSGNASSL